MRTVSRPVPAGGVALVVVLAAVVAVLLATGTGGHAPGPAPRVSAFSPVVRYTGRAPTGYDVTFRFRDPSASRVQIEGEWSFSSPALTSSARSEGLAPSDWRPGDITINPDAPADIAAGLKSTWPLARMTRDRRTGVWTYTTPLPSGVFNYGFVVNCINQKLTAAELADPNFPATYTGCPEIVDPSNRPWNESNGAAHGSTVTYSQVYVPSDPAFHTPDLAWEAPTTPRGSLTDIGYDGSDGPPKTPGRNYLAVYTPPGYDPHRTSLYPTLYLSHGYDNNEIDWSTGGDAANILDNLIDTHVISPMVVVMPNAYWEAPPSPTRGGAITYDANLLRSVIPYIESRYDVSRRPARRAFAGLSYGGYVAGTLLLNDTGAFGYYGLFSPAPFAVQGVGAHAAAGLRRVGLLVGAGLDDGAATWAAADVRALRRAGAPVVSDFINGGHDWFVWRVLLHDFLTRVAFKPAR